MQIPLLDGSYMDQQSHFRDYIPINIVPVPKSQGVSEGYYRTADGIKLAALGFGIDRGGILYNGFVYRVSGNKLVSIEFPDIEGGPDAITYDRGTVDIDDRMARFDYGFDRLAVASGGKLYYYDPDALTLTQVTDPDLGFVYDMLWVDGYFMTTDREFLVVTELNDPTSVNPIKYGSSEADPDPINALRKHLNEIYVINRFTTEIFQNVGGSGFPFARVESGFTPKGCVSSSAACNVPMGVAIVGSGRNEQLAVYILASGNYQKISTREIDRALELLDVDSLYGIYLEYYERDAHEFLNVHINGATYVYDFAATKIMGSPMWHRLKTDETGTYRAVGYVQIDDTWCVGDKFDSKIGILDRDTPLQYEEEVEWSFQTRILYNQSKGAIIHAMELFCITGNAVLGHIQKVFTSWSEDGRTFSNERAANVGSVGQYQKRVIWRRLGTFRNFRIIRFRGKDKTHFTTARLEAEIEVLNG